MAEIVVNPTASSNGSGSLLDPKNTYNALATAPGDVVLQVAGTTHNGRLRPTANGTAGARITYGVCNPQTGERVYGRGLAKVVGGAGQHGADFLTFNDYITLDSLELVGGTGTSRHGLSLLAATIETLISLELLRCVLRCGPNATSDNGASIRGRGVTISDSEFAQAYADALFLNAADVLIEDTDIHDFDAPHPNGTRGGTGDGIQFSNGSTTIGTSIIRRTRIIGHRDNPIKQCFLASAGAGSLRVEDCEMYGMGITCQSETPNTVFRRNRIWGGTSRGLSLGANGIKAHMNRISHTPNAMLIGSNITGAELRNNTLLASELALFLGGSCSAVLRNNVLDAPWIFDRYGGVTLDSNHNAWGRDRGARLSGGSTTYANRAAWLAAQGTDAASLDDLLATPDGYPLAGSPLLTMGADLGYMRDIEGKQGRRFIGAVGRARRERV